MRRMALLLLIVAAGCGGGGDGAAADGGGRDGATGAADAARADAAGASDGAAALDWESVEPLAGGVITIERVTYRSEGLLIVGRVCRPAGDGPFPLLVSNHGGFAGIGDFTTGTCRDAAGNGYAVIESSYRGEDGSDGEVEVCLGEVTDVLSMMEIVLAKPWADPGRVLMLGASHGGCITLRAVQRGAAAQVAVALVPPTDWAAEYRFWRTGLASSPTETQRAIWEALVAQLDASVGGPPESFAAAYAERSPVTFAADLAASPIDVMVVNAMKDELVPGPQGCLIAAAAGGFAAYHVANDGAVVDAPPAGCEESGLTWRTTARPAPSWPEDRYLMVYEATDHGLTGPTGQIAVGDALQFLIAHTPAP